MTPGIGISSANAVMPARSLIGLSMREPRHPQSACCPIVVHTFWPSMINVSPSGRARVRKLARSLRASGSLNS